MTQLSRQAVLGIAKETTVGTYVPPTAFLPFTKATFEDQYTTIKDTSVRANDSVQQGLYQGVVHAEWGIDLFAYPDVTGHFLRGIIGPDTLTAGITTATSASSIAGATTLSTTASIAAQSYIQIDTAGLQEYAKVTAVSGVGPYTLTVQGAGTAGGLLFAHSSAAAVVSQTTHTFKQSTALPKATYSLSVYDTTGTLGYPDTVFSDLQIKIDPKGALTLSTKAKSFPGAVQSVLTPTYTAPDPILGWEWLMTNGGSASTRGLTLDLTVKRAVDVIHSSDGIQAPREIFQGAIEADGSYKAIFEDQSDLTIFLQNLQLPVTAALQAPTAKGAASLTLTMSKSGWSKGVRDLSGNYVQASFTLSGLHNSTDGGVIQAILKNFVAAAY